DHVGSGLDRVVVAVPDDVAFQDVRRTVADRAVGGDARKVGVVNYVVAGRVAVTAFLDLDAVALLHVRTVGVVDVVALDQAVGNATAVVIAAEVHALAGAVRVMDVVAQDAQAFVRAARVRGDRDVAGLVNLAALDRDEARAHQTDAVRAAGELDAAKGDVAR